MTENERENCQTNVQIVKSQEEMGKIHSYHDTWLRALNIFLYFFLGQVKGKKTLKSLLLPGF